MSKWSASQLKRFINEEDEQEKTRLYTETDSYKNAGTKKNTYQSFKMPEPEYDKWGREPITAAQTPTKPFSTFKPSLSIQPLSPQKKQTNFALTETLNQMYAEKKEKEKQKFSTVAKRTLSSPGDSIKTGFKGMKSALDNTSYGMVKGVGLEGINRALGSERTLEEKFFNNAAPNQIDKMARGLGEIGGQFAPQLGAAALTGGASLGVQALGNAVAAGTTAGLRGYGDGKDIIDSSKDALRGAIFAGAGTAGSHVVGNAIGEPVSKLGALGKETLKGLGYDLAGYAAERPTYAIAGDQAPTLQEMSTDMIVGMLMGIVPDALEVRQLDLPTLKRVKAEAGPKLSPEVQTQIDRRIYEMQEGYSLESDMAPYEGMTQGNPRTYQAYDRNGMPLGNNNEVGYTREMPHNSQNNALDNRYVSDKTINQVNPYKQPTSYSKHNMDQYGESGNKSYNYFKKDAPYPEVYDTYFEMMYAAGINNFPYEQLPRTEFDTVFPEYMKQSFFNAGRNDRGTKITNTDTGYTPKQKVQPQSEYERLIEKGKKDKEKYDYMEPLGKGDRVIIDGTQEVGTIKSIDYGTEEVELLRDNGEVVKATARNGSTHNYKVELVKEPEPKQIPQTQKDIKYLIEEKELLGERQKQVYEYLKADKDGKKAKAYYLSPELKGVDDLKKVLGSENKLIKFTDDKSAPKLDVMKMEFETEFPEVKDMGLEEFGTFLVDTVKKYKGDAKAIATMKQEAKELSKQDIIPEPPKKGTFETTKETISKLNKGYPTTIEEVKAGYEYIRDNEQVIKEQLKKKTVAELKKQVGVWSAQDKKKPELIDAAYEEMISGILHRIKEDDSQGISVVMGWGDNRKLVDVYKERVEKRLSEMTQDDLNTKLKKRNEQVLQYVKERNAKLEAVKNPKTLEEFKEAKKYRKLSAEEQRTYDELFSLANKSKAVEIKAKEVAKTSMQMQGDLPSHKITKDVDTRDQSDMWVLKFDEQLSKEDYKKYSDLIKQKGGYYSRYKKGFIFKNEPDLTTKKVDVEEVKADIEMTAAEKQKTNADKIRQVADTMQKSIDNKRADRQTNTARRASMAADAERQADELENTQRILRGIADQLETGNIKHLDKVSAATHVETLQTLIRWAQREYVNKLSDAENLTYDQRKSRESKLNNEGYPVETLDNVRMPQIVERGFQLKDLINAAERADAKDILKEKNRLNKLLNGMNENDRPKLSERDQADIYKIVSKIPKADLPWHVDESMKRLNRLEKMGITTDSELRAALRELDSITNSNRKIKSPEEIRQEKIKAKERELVDSKITSFFPTPEKVIDQMLEIADIKPGERVLEPSAGAGDIADKVGIGKVEVVEYNGSLRELLELKGHTVVGSNALEVDGTYNKIIMNPPFEKNQDIQHVTKAFNDNLEVDGRIVAIMSNHFTFANDKASIEFRQLVDEYGVWEPLPEGTFKESKRSTGVNTVMVTLDKPSGEIKIEPTKEAVEAMTLPEETMRSKKKLGEAIEELEKKKSLLPLNLQHFAETKIKQYKSLLKQLESEGLSQDTIARVKELQAEMKRYKKQAETNYMNNEVNKLKAKEAKKEAVDKEKQKGIDKVEATKEKLETKHERELNEERMKAALEKEDIKDRAETKLEKTKEKLEQSKEMAVEKERNKAADKLEKAESKAEAKLNKTIENYKRKMKTGIEKERVKAAFEKSEIKARGERKEQIEKVKRDVDRFKNIQSKNKQDVAKKLKQLKHIKRNLKTLNPEFKERIEPLVDFVLGKDIGNYSEFDLEKFKKTLEKHGVPTEIEEDSLMDKMAKSMIERIGKTIKVSDMSYDQFNGVYETVATLVHANKTMNKFISKSRYKNMKVAVNSLKDNMTLKHGENGGRKLNKKTGRLEAKKQSILDGLNSDMETIKTTIAKIEGTKGGPMKEILYDNFMSGHTRKYDFNRRTQEFFKERFKKIDLKSLEKSKYTVNTEQGEVSLTSLEKVSIALNSFNDKNRYSILESGFSLSDNKKAVYKIDEVELEKLISDLTPDEVKLMDTLFEYYETINKTAINDVSMKLFNYEVATEDWYYPKKVNTDYAVVKEIGGMEDVSALNHLMGGNLENAGFMKSKRMTKTPILLHNPLELAMRMADEVGDMYAYAVPLRDAKLLLKKARTDIEYTYGAHGYKRLLDYVNSYTQGVYEKTNAEKWYNKGTNNVVKAIFGLNIGTIAKQPLGLFNAANEIESRYIVQAMGRKLSPLGIKKTKELMHQYAPMTYERAHGNVNKELNNHTLEKDVNRAFYGKESIFDKATIGIAKADEYLCNTIWLASEYKVRKEQPELTGEAFYKKVGALTEEIIITSQGGPLNTHTSPLFAKEDILSKTITRFQTQANASYNQALIAAERLKESKGIMSKAKASAEFTETMLKTVALPALLAIGVNLGVDYLSKDESKIKTAQKAYKYGNKAIVKGTLTDVGSNIIEEMLGVNSYLGVVKDFADEILLGFSNDDVLNREVKTFAESVKRLAEAKELEGWEVYKSGKNKGENKKETLIREAGEGMLKSLGKLAGLPVNWGTKLYNIGANAVLGDEGKKTEEEWAEEMTPDTEKEVKKDYDKALEKYKATGQMTEGFDKSIESKIKGKSLQAELRKMKDELEKGGGKWSWKENGQTKYSNPETGNTYTRLNSLFRQIGETEKKIEEGVGDPRAQQDKIKGLYEQINDLVEMYNKNK